MHAQPENQSQQHSHEHADFGEMSGQEPSHGADLPFHDTRPEALQRQKIQQAANESAQVRQLMAYQNMAQQHVLQRHPIQSAMPLQLKVAVPEYSGNGHSTGVRLKAVKGDTMSAGSKPTADVSGFNALKTLGLTNGDDNDHRWVKFHVLNEKAGGSGKDPANLTPASQTANHATDWNTLEKEERNYLEHAHEMGGSVLADSVEYAAAVGYHGSRTVYWKNSSTGETLTTDSANYPSAISAKLDVKWKDADIDKSIPASLDAADGLVRPEDLDVPGWKAYSDATHKTPI